MSDWWSGLQVRERIILAVAAVIGLLIVLDTLVFQPVSSSSAGLDEKIAQAKSDLEWMKSAIQRLPLKGSDRQKVRPDRIVSFIDKQINSQGLKKNLQQMAPIQDNSARLRLSEVEFSRLLRFLSALQGSVTIDEVRLLPGENAGFVNVSMVISNGAAT